MIEIDGDKDRPPKPPSIVRPRCGDPEVEEDAS